MVIPTGLMVGSPGFASRRRMPVRVLAKAGVTDPGSWIPEVYAAPEE